MKGPGLLEAEEIPRLLELLPHFPLEQLHRAARKERHEVFRERCRFRRAPDFSQRQRAESERVGDVVRRGDDVDALLFVRIDGSTLGSFPGIDPFVTIVVMQDWLPDRLGQAPTL